MIKRFDEITIKDFDRIERTGVISHLRMWYNILPTFIFANKISKELDKLVKMLNGEDFKSTDDAIAKDIVRRQVEVLQLRIAFYGLVNNLHNRSVLYNIALFYITFGNRKLKIKTDSNFEYFAKIAKDISGINVETAADLSRLRKRIELKNDKLNEHIAKITNPKTDRVYLIAFAMSVCSVLGINYSSSMTVVELIEAKKMAEEKIKQHNKNGGNK